MQKTWPRLLASVLLVPSAYTVAALPSLPRSHHALFVAPYAQEVGTVRGVDGHYEELQQVRSNTKGKRPTLSSESGVHEVEHVSILNNSRFWWLLGAVVVCVGVAVVRMEIGDGDIVGSKGEEDVGDGYTFAGAVHLCSCVVALQTAMLIWGVGQEFVMTNLYEDDTGRQEKVPDALFVVLCNRAVCTCFAGLLLLLHGRGFGDPGFIPCLLPAASNLIASWAQYQSLAYISFTLQTTVKSSKLLPVVLVSSLRGRRHSLQDYAEVLVIGAALVVFGLETEGKEAQHQDHSTARGVALLGVLVCFDSLTPHFQDYLFKSRPNLSALQATFAMAGVAMVLATLVLGGEGQLGTCIGFVWRNPESMLHIAVLSMASTLTQFLISHTIKYFGPVVFTLIATTRQAISVSISALFFAHHISGLAVTSAVLLFSTVLVRGLRPLASGPVRRPGEVLLSQANPETPGARPGQTSVLGVLARWSHQWQLLLCALGIHVLFCFYAMVQEFISIHTFGGKLFTFPLFLIAVNRTLGGLFAFCLLKAQGLSVFNQQMKMTLLPAVPNFLATVPQYQALYHLFFPAQVLMKSMKVLPVMLCGRLLRNRVYSHLDYAEGLVITALVGFFVWDFQLHKGHLGVGNVSTADTQDLLLGSVLMLGYIIMDSLTTNLEDHVYQVARLDPAQQMFGIEVFSGIAAWGILLVTGEFRMSVAFFSKHPEALQFMSLLAVSSALGTYACTVTVRLFGPAVFTLLMVSRQIISLALSVLVFRHTVDWLCCLCLAAVSLLILTASLRQVGQQKQLTWEREEDFDKDGRLGLPPGLLGECGRKEVDKEDDPQLNNASTSSPRLNSSA